MITLPPQFGVHAALDGIDPNNHGRVGMEAYWSLDEASGTRLDSHGANDLADTNTVGSVAAIVNNGADFERSNSEKLSIGDNASLSMGDIDFWTQGFFKLESLGVNAIMVYKSQNNVTTTTAREYSISIDTAGELRWVVANNSINGVVIHTKTFVTATWYHIAAYHDSVNDLLGVSIDAAAFETAAYSGGSFNSNGTFNMGKQSGGTNYMDGIMDEWSFHKNNGVPTIGNVEWMNNSGNGRSYSEYT